MRAVIGKYDSRAAAASALRVLESKISIQGIVIAEHGERGPESDSKKRFAVSMTGTQEAVAQARSLLQPEGAHTDER